MHLSLMSTQVTFPSEPLVTKQTLSSFPGAMRLVVSTHILLTRISKVTTGPRTINRLQMSSKMIVPHAIFPKGPIAFRPNAEPSSMLYKLVVFQTNGRIFSERLLAAYIGA
jgi:hypothetical protein